MNQVDPFLCDRIDLALWELMLDIHVGVPKQELIERVQRIRWMRQGERANVLANHHMKQGGEV